MYKEQLLSPIAMFQFFCSVLWMLDEYWQYTMFTLFSICLIESGTVFQRQRTLGTLSGMSTKPYDLYVFRAGAWSMITTEDILPGDVISLNRFAKSAKDKAAAA